MIEMRGVSTGRAGFADLICADPAWLHAEFDAIIAANFGVAAGQPPLRGSPRPAPEARDRPGDQTQGRGPAARTSPDDLARTARRVRARERSPPPRAVWPSEQVTGQRKEVVSGGVTEPAREPAVAAFAPLRSPASTREEAGPASRDVTRRGTQQRSRRWPSIPLVPV
ncbi:hypothetical protein [Crossiella sp. NPDC003009]